MEKDRNSEKQRNLKVLDVMNKKRENELGGKVDGNLKGAKPKFSALGKAKKRKTGKKN